MFSLLCVLEVVFCAFIHLKISNSSEFNVADFYISENLCISSFTFLDGSEKFNISGGNITHVRFDALSTNGCRESDVIDSYSYKIGDTVSWYFPNNVTTRNFTGQMFYYFDELAFLPASVNGSVIGNYTGISFFTDFDCGTSLPYSIYPNTLHFRRSYLDRINLQYQEFSCTNESFFIHYWNVHEKGVLEFVKEFKNLPDDECTDRLSHGLLRRRREFQSFIKKCYKSTSEFEQDVVQPNLNMCNEDSTKNFQLQKVYYTLECSNNPFMMINKPQKLCNQIGKIYCNNGTYRTALRYAEVDCTKGILEIRSGMEELACRSFKDAEYYVNQPTWGYDISLEDDVAFPNYLAFTVVKNCSLTKNENFVKYVKTNRALEFYYFMDDRCIKEADYTGTVVIDGATSIRGSCLKGKISAKNYTFQDTCENVYEPITSDFCATNINNYGLYWTCIPFFCNGISEYDSTVCNGHGECNASDSCRCSYGYDGKNCGQVLSTSLPPLSTGFEAVWLSFLVFPFFFLICLFFYCCYFTTYQLTCCFCFCCCCCECYRRLMNRKPVAPNDPVLTFVFTDIKESTLLWNTYPKEMRKALQKHDKILTSELKKKKGFEVKTIGDAFFVVFKNPINALDWTCAIQKRLVNVKWPTRLLESKHCSPLVSRNGVLIRSGLMIRIGIHTGKMFIRKKNRRYRSYDYVGQTINKTSRVEQSAETGFIHMTKSTFIRVKKHLKRNRKKYYCKKLKTQKLKGFKGRHRLYYVLPYELRERCDLSKKKGENENDEKIPHTESGGLFTGDSGSSGESSGPSDDEELEEEGEIGTSGMSSTTSGSDFDEEAAKLPKRYQPREEVELIRVQSDVIIDKVRSGRIDFEEDDEKSNEEESWVESPLSETGYSEDRIVANMRINSEGVKVIAVDD